ncbi:hypothetical protein E4U54_002151, partial [Claviceps lovelessii]
MPVTVRPVRHHNEPGPVNVSTVAATSKPWRLDEKKRRNGRGGGGLKPRPSKAVIVTSQGPTVALLRRDVSESSKAPTRAIVCKLLAVMTGRAVR